jgi:hypothetical protein
VVLVVALSGHLVGPSEQAVGSDQLAGSTPYFSLEIAGDEQKVPAVVDASGGITGSVRIPRPATGSAHVTVHLVSEGGQGDVCASHVEAEVTALGIAVEISSDRPRCYLERPCAVTARFRLPADPVARRLGEAFLSSPALAVVARTGGTTSPLATERGGQVDAAWHGTVVPTDTGEVMIEAIGQADGGVEVHGQAAITVEPPIVLSLPTALDLGTVRAGTASNHRCTALDFSKSRGVIYQRFRLTATRPSGCNSFPVVYDAATGVGFPVHGDGVELEVRDDRRVTLCLAEIPRCADESPAPVVLTVQALSPDFPEQHADVEIVWRVAGRSLWACWWWLIAAIAGLTLAVIIGYGFIRPFRFEVDDQVTLSAKREQLARATGRRLRDLPGGRPGWYRSAAVSLLDNGQASARLGQGVVELHARRGEVVIRSRSGLERISPQSKKLEPVAEAARREGHVASRNVVCRAGALFFRIK